MTCESKLDFQKRWLFIACKEETTAAEIFPGNHEMALMIHCGRKECRGCQMAEL